MPLFDIGIEVVDGERGYSSHRQVFADKRETVEAWAKEELKKHWGDDTQFEDDDNLYSCKAYDAQGEVVADIMNILEVEATVVINLDTGKWMLVEHTVKPYETEGEYHD